MKTKWPSPVLLVPKMDEALRLGVAQQTYFSSPLVIFTSQHEWLSIWTRWWVLNYFQHGIQIVTINRSMLKKNRKTTAFTTSHGLHQFMRCPLGLTNALDTFERMMNVPLCTVRGKYLLLHLNDIVVYLNTPEDHTEHPSSFCPLEHVDIVLKLVKWSFSCN